MRQGWDELPLGQASLKIIDGDRGKAYPKHGDFSDDDYCLFLSTANVTSSGFDFSECQFISEQKDEELRKGRLSRQDVVLTTRGTLGNAALYGDEVPYDHVRINSGMVIMRADPAKLLPAFLFGFLRSPGFKGQVEQLRSGVAQPQLPIRDIYKITLPLPRKEVQQRIVAVFAAYDDLIENNRRRMALLEEATRQLYREWFVRLRFPGHEHTPITNGVPEGWERLRLSELAEITMGQSPESRYYNEDGEGLPFHQGVTDFGDRFVTHRIYSTALNRIAESGDILCSVRAPVGRLNVTLDKIVIGRGLAALRSKTGHQALLLQQLRAYFFKEDLIGGGAIFASVTKKEFSVQVLLEPPERLKRAFEEVTVPCDEQIRALHLQNQQLRAARDLLLPRLMSGEIAV
ncbi:MAG: restriction endonuclease subunit S [candidate division NC10 bacterium]|nr:restriction endonuclease subunit S [candidate division NC10 bacterium]MDE2323030.1 restriction endonuclease subunit S [candidate division NC10 bacterium]